MNDEKDDIALGAYIDGELPDEEMRALDVRLASEPALAERLNALRATNTAAREHFAVMDERPMPQGVLDLLEQEEETADTSNVVAFPRKGIRQFFQAPVAIAASVALLAGFLVSGLLRDTAPVDPGFGGLQAGVLDTGSELHEFLDNGLSGNATELAAGVNGTLLLTFEDTAGDYCRQLQIEGSGVPVQGVACRRGGQWHVEATGIAADRAPDGSYQQASGSTPAAIDSAIDGLIGANPPLDTEAEIALISKAWKKSPE